MTVAALSDDPIKDWIITEGKATEIRRISSIGGGCISLANRYETDAGSFFVKTNRYAIQLHLFSSGKNFAYILVVRVKQLICVILSDALKNF